MVVGVSASEPHRRSRHRRCLVVVSVSSFLAAASILVAASVGFCDFSLFSCSLGILSLAASHCCRRRQILFVSVVVLRSLIVDGVFLLSSAAPSCRCRQRRRCGVL